MTTNDLILDTSYEIKHEILTLFNERRIALGLNVRELGAKANVSYTVIYDLEKRSILPKMDTLIKLATALDLNVTIKKLGNNESKAVSIVFHNSNNINFDKTPKKPELTIDQQLEKILSFKKLFPDEIEEVKEYIEFKVSQHHKNAKKWVK